MRIRTGTRHRRSPGPVRPMLHALGRALPLLASLLVTMPVLGADARLYLQPGGPYALQSHTLDFEGRDLAFSGNHVYIAAGNAGLVVMALQDQAPPRQVAQLTIADQPIEKIRVSGDIAWLIGPKGLSLVDISVPEDPLQFGHYPTPVPPVDLALGETRAWLLLPREILNFDLSVGGIPVLIGRSGLRFEAYAIAARQERVFLAAGEAGLISFDARNPPLHVTGYRAGGPVTDVTMADRLLYAAGSDGSITIIEHADVDGLRWRGSFRLDSPVQRIDTVDGQALAVTADRRLWLIDVTNPEAIRIADRLTGDCCDAVHHGGRRALTLAGSRLTTWDLGPQRPQTGNEGLAFGQGVNLGGQRRVFIEDDIAYVADWFAGLHVYALDDPARPRLLSSLQTGGSAKGVVVRDGIAWVADDDHGLQVIDVRDPTRPQVIANLPTPGLAYTPVLDGDRLWLAVHHGGIVVIDISAPASPAVLAHYETPGKSWSLRLRDGIAWVADDEAGLLIIDVGDLDHPQVLASYAPGARAEEVLIDGDTAYVAFFDLGVHIIDISDPTAPRRISHVMTPGNPRGLDLHNGRLHVADWRAGVQIVDVSDPRQPRILGHYDTDGAAWGVRASGDHLFVADWWGGITMLDISESARPLALGHYPQRTRIEAIAAAGDHAWLAQGAGGVQIFDIDNPLNPTWVSGIELAGARDIAVLDGHAYVLQDDAIAILEIATDDGSARQAGAMAIDHDVRALRPAGERLLLLGAARLSLLDPIDGHARTFDLDTTINDAWFDDDLLFVATDSGLRIIDPVSGEHQAYADSRGIGPVRAAGGLLVSAVHGTGIEVRSRTTRERLATIPVTDAIRDLVLDGHILHVLTAAPGVFTLDLSDPADWRVQSYQEILNDVSAMILHHGTLYLAGASRLLAIEPLPPLRDHSPPALPPGAYDFAAAGADLPGPVVERQAVVVAPLRFGRPALSAEAFEALKRDHLGEP